MNGEVERTANDARASGLTNGILQALRDTGEGVGCDYYTRRDPGVPARLLSRLGLVRMIDRTPPECESHGCPLLGQCEYEGIFSDRTARRSGIKFRLTLSGLKALDAPDEITAAVRDTYVARTVLESLQSGPKTALELNTVLMERATREIRATGRPGESEFTRSEFRNTLELLVACGVIGIRGGQYELPL